MEVNKFIGKSTGLCVLSLFCFLFTYCGDGGKKVQHNGNTEKLTRLDDFGYWSLIDHKFIGGYKVGDREDIKLNGIKVKLEDDSTYKFVIKFDDSFVDFKEYYLLINLYPQDDAVNKLDLNRKKYGFESFSAKISQKKGKIYASRNVKTDLDRLRAITFTIISYETKDKVREVILQNIDLNKLTITQ